MYTELDVLEMQFYNHPHDIIDGVLSFYEPGYDYYDPDFWSSFDPQPTADFITACQIYDKIFKLSNAE